MATLSCTDCSGSSTASSDITEPGSPYSTASSHSEDSLLQQAPKMAPNTGAHHPPWPWRDTEGGGATAAKRSRQQAPTHHPKHDTNSNVLPPDRRSPTICQSQAKPQQGKITEYFKSQIKANGAKKDIVIKANGDVLKKVEPSSGKQKFFALIDAPKVILTGAKCAKLPAELYKKLVHATATDKKPRKVLQLPIKLLPKTAHCITASSIDSLFASVKRPPGNMQPPQKVTSLSLKVSSTVVPIVKLNSLPSKPNNSVSSNNSHAHATLSVETGVPTVPVPKPKACTTEPPRPTSPRLLDRPLKTPKVPEDSGGSDSGVSSPLSICVNTEGSGEASQKSPILSQPKTIRFPAEPTERRGSDAGAGDTSGCRWSGCRAGSQFDTGGALLDHLQLEHVLTQATRDTYVCEWAGCKVQGRTSCSRTWLERHVLSHAGSKPFRCIVHSCGGRFSTQQALERHVNGHFNGSDSGQAGSSSRRSTDSQGAPKLFKRNGKKLRYRRQPWSGKHHYYLILFR